MAAENHVQTFREEAPRPVCLEDFTAPVALACGNNSCQAPLSPQGRDTEQQGPLQPNWQLANVVELSKPLSFQAAKRARWDGVYGEHQETLKWFCEENQTPICVVCDRSQAPRVLPIKEAAQEYKEKLEAHLKTLRVEREQVLGRKTTAEGKCQEYLGISVRVVLSPASCCSGSEFPEPMNNKRCYGGGTSGSPASCTPVVARTDSTSQ